jgi:hypothetical protein
MIFQAREYLIRYLGDDQKLPLIEASFYDRGK